MNIYQKALENSVRKARICDIRTKTTPSVLPAQQGKDPPPDCSRYLHRASLPTAQLWIGREPSESWFAECLAPLHGLHDGRNLIWQLQLESIVRRRLLALLTHLVCLCGTKRQSSNSMFFGVSIFSWFLWTYLSEFLPLALVIYLDCCF